MKEELQWLYFAIIGIFTGIHAFMTRKDIHSDQPDLHENGYFFTGLVIIFGNLLNYGILISFTLNRWEGIGEFLIFGLKDSVEIVAGLF